jgi:hypothetical protein
MTLIPLWSVFSPYQEPSIKWSVKTPTTGKKISAEHVESLLKKHRPFFLKQEKIMKFKLPQQDFISKSA